MSATVFTCNNTLKFQKTEQIHHEANAYTHLLHMYVGRKDSTHIHITICTLFLLFITSFPMNYLYVTSLF